MRSTHTAELDIPELPLAARRVHVVPALKTHSLLSVGQLCDAGCEAHFTSTNVTVTCDDKTVITGNRTSDSKLWRIDPTTDACNGSSIAACNVATDGVTTEPALATSPTATGTQSDIVPSAVFVPVTMPPNAPNTNSLEIEPLQPNESANAALHGAAIADQVAFSHAALFSPVLSTLHQAIDKGYLTNFPGLTTANLRRHPPSTIATDKGHMDQSRKNQRSTKPKQPVSPPKPTESPTEPNTDTPDDAFPIGLTTADSAHEHCCFVDVFEPTGKIYTDQTGKFVAQSSTGNNYIMLLYDYDSNCILAQPFANRKSATILAAFKALHQTLTARGMRPKIHILDNECSAELKSYLQSQQIDYQLAPPHVHRRNAAERAIRTFKNHFIAGLCSLDPRFPLHLWDRLLPQAVITLNLLRGSRVNPKQSAWAQYNGQFDFDRTPLGPPGCRVLAHEKPTARETWAPHAVDGWYIGPALESYRCYRVWMWETKRERVCDTLSWHPSKISVPTVQPVDEIRAALHDIMRAIVKPPTTSPQLEFTPTELAALRNLDTILHGGTETTTEPEPAASLRVALPTATATAATPLRVATLVETVVEQATDRETPPAPPAPPASLAPPAARTPATAPATANARPDITYAEATGAAARRSRRARKPSAKAQALAAVLNRAYDEKHFAFHGITHHCFHGHAVNPDTGKIAEYQELCRSSAGQVWQNGASKEIARLCKGLKKDTTLIGTNTMEFVKVTSIPRNIVPTYLRIVCAYRPEKEDPYRVRFTVGGDRIIYLGDASTKTSDLTTAKLLFNSVLSTPGAKFCTIDIKDFYLNTPMSPEEYAYMRIPRHAIPDDIFEEYELADKMHNGHAYVQIKKGMYGLKQAGRLANDQLVTFLEKYGYRPVEHTPGLWRHDTRPITFTLVVDDFGVQYTSQEDLDHLLDALRSHYKISFDPTGTKYCGLDLAWDYTKRTCHVSMPGYIERALQRFKHEAPSKPQHSPHPWVQPDYGAKTQLTAPIDSTKPLDKHELKYVQEVLGTLLYYARAVDCTMLPAIGTLASQQSNGTQATLQNVRQLLDYCATHPDATIPYSASDMVLNVESDASYLSERKARSRAAGFFHLGKKAKPGDKKPPEFNGPVHILSQIMREVLSSAAEAEMAALFYNCKEACTIRTTLEEMGYPQPATPVVTDNSTAAGIANATVKQRRSKAIDMRYYWVRDRTRQKQFQIVWRKGKYNRADYISKHHPASHHQAIRSAYVSGKEDGAHKNYFQILQEEDDEKETNDIPPDRGEGVLKTRPRTSRASGQSRHDPPKSRTNHSAKNSPHK
jgi:Reverse transcriptase (RNA-dependent DNA polymerase)